MNLLRSVINWLMGIFSKTTTKPLPQEGIHYQLVDLAPDLAGVKILDGPYEDVIYYYGQVKIYPEKDRNILSFDYAIFDCPLHVDVELHLKANEFKQYIGDILTAILLSDKGEYATARDLDSEESNLQRTIHEESDSLPQG